MDDLRIDPTEYIAHLVFEFRVAANYERETGKTQDEEYQRQLRFRDRLLQAIADEFQASMSQGELELRIPPNLELHEVLKANHLTLVTTNWDTLLEKEFGKDFPIIHLHGSIQEPKTLYLPTEVCFESYRFVEPGPAQEVRDSHREVYQILKKARRIIAWGVSFNLYDSELSVLVSESHRYAPEPEKKKYWVINPCKLPARRLEFLTAMKPKHIFPNGDRCKGECCREETNQAA